MLGVLYNTQSWQWSFSKNKINSLILLPKTVTENEKVSIKTLRIIYGKLEFYKSVTSSRGKWERGFIFQCIGTTAGTSSCVQRNLPSLTRSPGTGWMNCTNFLMQQVVPPRRQVCGSLVTSLPILKTLNATIL